MITSAVIVTKDRRAEAARCASMHLASVRKPEVIILDQTQNAEPYKECRFVGQADVDKYIDLLHAESGVPKRLLRFGLVGEYGGYRNVALLDTIGKQILSTDDDVLPIVSPPPGQEPNQLYYAYANDAPSMWWFRTRDEWRREFEVDFDLAGKHEVLLGSTTEDNFEVRATMAGILGDCASPTNFAALVALGADRDKLMNDYQANIQSREVLQAYTGLVVTREPFFRTVCVALDNSTILPPFMPVDRNECGIFAILLHAAFPTACIGHIPWAVHHVPEGRTGFHSVFPATGAAGLLLSMLYALGDGPLEWLGLELEKFSELSLAQVREFAHMISAQSTKEMRALLEARLQIYDTPAQWVEDACKALLLLSEPEDIPVQKAAQMQQQIVMFGRLLQVWTKIYSSAETLSKKGIRVSREASC